MIVAATHPWNPLTRNLCTDQWDVQELIVRLVRSLQARGYLVWFDLDNMKGSTVDA